MGDGPSDTVALVTEDVLDVSTQRFRENPSLDETVSQTYETNNSHLPKQDSAESSGTLGIPEMRVYKRRWYILILFSLMACHQCAIWNTWGPIASSVQSAYGWSDGTVAMMANWGNFMFVLTAVPLSWMVERKGVRPTVLLVSGLIMVGSVLRCCRYIISDPQVFLAASHICAIFDGIAGVTIMAAPPLISSLWFPINERTTATSINQAGNMLGNGLSMLIGPALVMLNDTNTNDTSFLNFYETFGIQSTVLPSNRDKEDIKDDIDDYMIIDAGAAAAIFFLIAAYFPSKPPLAPTLTSVIVRTDFTNGLKKLVCDKDILLTCFAYSLSQGIMGSWMGVMVFNLRPLGISDQEIGYIGLGSVLGQCFASMLAGYLSDWLRKRIKICLIILLTVSGAIFVLLTFMCLQVISTSYPVLFFVIVSATSLNFACCPLFFELSVEIAYPVSESLIGGFLTTIYNLVGIVFLFLFFIPNIGSIWINYVLVGSVVLSIPAVILVKERYNRSSVDELVNGIEE